MVKEQRQDMILGILNETGFVTAKELIVRTDYSSATIHRDLIELEHKGLIRRCNGGAEALNRSSIPPLPLRYDFQKEEKRRIAAAAAMLIKDGDTIFVDACTTTSYILQCLTEKKNVHIITNNIELALRVSLSGLKVTVLGGKVCERPSMLAGDLTVENIMRFRADKAFFSTVAFSHDGRISGGDPRHLIHRAMMERSNQVFYLACASKCQGNFEMDLCTMGDVDYVVSDYVFSDAVKNKYSQTMFVQV